MATAYSGGVCTNYGGYFFAYGVNGGHSYGIYAECVPACSSATCFNTAGYFNGDVVSTVGYFVSSDMNLKDNITPLTDGLTILNQLQPKTYTYNALSNPQMSLPVGVHAGLLAQDVEQVMPTLVKDVIAPAKVDSLGTIIFPEIPYKAINYTELTPYIIASINQLQTKIDSLTAVVAVLSNSNPITPKMANPNTIEVTLSNQSKIILNQNDPNPFAENTTINYFIPDNVNAAQLLFYDNSGTILKTVDIKEKGTGSILIYGSNLSSGVYTYTLLADGKVMETKRMVKVK